MHSALTLSGWLDATYWLHLFGPWALGGAVAIVFAECGLLLGFFLPGDSLLFTVGLLISTGDLDQPLWLACVLLTVAAFVGNVSGYEIGRRAGPAIFRREDSRLFRREYVEKTVRFFDTYGPRAIVLARFVPIVRTFITVTAGVGQMNRRRYLAYSGLGGAVWATGVTVLGSLLGRFAFIKTNIEAILLLIVLISVIPVGLELLRERRKQRRALAQTAAGAAPPASPGSAADPVVPGDLASPGDPGPDDRSGIAYGSGTGAVPPRATRSGRHANKS